MSEKSALSNKDLAFVNEYFLCNMNATEAGRRMGYAHPNVQGPRLLVKVSILQEIQRRLDEQKMSSKEVLARISAIGRGDIADFVGIETPADLLREEYRGKTHVIKKFKRNVTITRMKDGGEIENQYTELELHDSLSALDKMGRHHVIFTDKVEHSGSIESKFVVLPPKREE